MKVVRLLVSSFLLFSGLAAAQETASERDAGTGLNADSDLSFLDPFAGQNVVETSGCSAQASCGSYNDVSCTSEQPSSCAAVDRNCSAGEQGYVHCGGSYTYCPALPCTCGDTRWINTYQCDYSVNLYIWKEQMCVNEEWQYTGNEDLLVCCSGSCL